MYSTAKSTRMIGFAVTTALAGTLLAGCTTNAAPPAALSASQAEHALASGKHSQAIVHGEAAVLAEPRVAAYRSTLASAYLDAGRFASAETTFKDAMQLGDNSPRNALSLSLALSAQGKYPEAAALLNTWEGEIATADLGLALALAGQPERGIHLMSNAIRGGDNTAKMRQNLAYTYALAGRWREARLMASQDVPGDKLNDRIAQWAQMATPEAWQHRVAALLTVPVGVHDAGQPVQLALANNPSIEQLAAAAPTAMAAAEPAELAPLAIAATPMPAELPAVAVAEPVAEAPRAMRPTEFAAAFTAPALSVAPPAPVAQDAAQFVQQPVVQPTPVRTAAVSATPELRAVAVSAPSAPRAVAVSAAPAPRAAPRADGTHLVQLGSFASEAGAKRAWGIYLKKYPELSGHEMVISEAVVRGKRYWRVSAAGFGRSTASSMCGRVRAEGEGCFAYAEGRPLPGAVDRGVRLARR
jgi:Flp pilus assembly protein TadD